MRLFPLLGLHGLHIAIRPISMAVSRVSPLLFFKHYVLLVHRAIYKLLHYELTCQSTPCPVLLQVVLDLLQTRRTTLLIVVASNQTYLLP